MSWLYLLHEEPIFADTHDITDNTKHTEINLLIWTTILQNLTFKISHLGLSLESAAFIGMCAYCVIVVTDDKISSYKGMLALALS